MDAILAVIFSAPTAQVGLGALVTFMVLSLIRGWVVPRSVLVDRIADKQSQIDNLVKERDDWKEAYNKKAEINAELLKQNGALLDGAETTNKLLDALRMRMEWGNPGMNPSPPPKEIEE